MQHRDIKPSNVLVTPGGRVVILDFGLTSALLREGVTGTPAYLSPEQCRGDDVSNASDWYAVGVMLYHALTGRVPFDGTVREVIARKMVEDPPRASALAPDTPADLDEVCLSLLHRDPALRMSGRDLIERLSGGAVSAPSSNSGEASDALFVGRESSLDVLDAAFASVTAGRSATVVIYGPSGIGKSALVQHFIDRRLPGERVLVLRSRCHEHESIPYKGLDGVIDAVTRFLSGLSPHELAQLLPPDSHALTRLFPVMRALGVEPDLGQDADPILLRRQAFGAFRDLLGRLARRQPLVVDIDDFHWADADSVRWLTELLRPPNPSSLLILVSFRSEEIDAKPFLRALVERVDMGERLSLPLAPLSEDEVARMIEALLAAQARGVQRRGAGAPARQAEIARQSGGNPFLVEALARHVALGAASHSGATLDEMLMRRLETLPAESRAFLETLAICGRPELPARVFEACGFHGDDRPLVARLRAAHLLRNSRSGERVEMYHDRIRETLAARVSSDAARRIHDVMAHVLLAHEDDDPEALFEHYRAAGHTALAAAQAAAAAAKASGVLAFDFAATFYRHAVDLQPDAEERAAWNVQLARALENAGRPVEAAEAYLDAVRRASSGDQIEWRRKAAELFLIGGQIDRGLAVSDDVLRAVGMRLARGPRAAVASLALGRLQLEWRGLDFAVKAESQIPRDDLLRIDAAWSIAAGLAMVDPIRAAAFNVRQLLKALDVGDPYRVARALALEAGFSVVGVGAGLRRSVEFSRRAEALAEDVGHQYVAALTSLWAGIAAFLTGQWRRAAELCGRAVTTLRDECTGVTWELNMAHNFFLGGLVAQGELREVARHLPGLLHLARERGNFYLELELSTRMILVWLAADDPDGAEQRANQGIARWSQRGFQRQHFSHLLTRVQIELYRGRAREAWQLMASHEAPLRRSFFLRVQHTRVETANYRARCALAMAGAGHDARRMRAIAAHEASRIVRENMPWSNPFAQVLRATIACQEGEADAALKGLGRAIEEFESADMHLYAAVCRRRLSLLVGGDHGKALRSAADRWMAGQDIRDPAAMTRLATPGFPD
jgi:tetratricopeptide (TPR) repeat protein